MVSLGVGEGWQALTDHQTLPCIVAPPAFQVRLCGEGVLGSFRLLGAEACSGQESGVYCMARGGGERLRERSQLCGRQPHCSGCSCGFCGCFSVGGRLSAPQPLLSSVHPVGEGPHSSSPGGTELLLQHMVAGWSVEERLCLGHWTLIWPRRRTPWSRTR